MAETSGRTDGPGSALAGREKEKVSPGYSVQAVLRGAGSEPDTRFRPAAFARLDLHLLRLQVPFDSPPSYIREEPRSEIDVRPPQDCPQVCGLKNLIEREFYRQFRGRLKRYWRDEFTELPNLQFALYEKRLFAINGIGRGPDDPDSDYYTTATRESVFRRKREAEEEIPVVRVGPLMLLDSGSLSFDSSVLVRYLESEPEDRSAPEPEALEVGPGSEAAKLPLFAGKCYRLHTNFRLDFNPFESLRTGNPIDAFPHYGMVVQVAWLSDILRRERFTTECEAQYGHDGDLALFFNLVLKSW